MKEKPKRPEPDPALEKEYTMEEALARLKILVQNKKQILRAKCAQDDKPNNPTAKC